MYTAGSTGRLEFYRERLRELRKKEKGYHLIFWLSLHADLNITDNVYSVTESRVLDRKW